MPGTPPFLRSLHSTMSSSKLRVAFLGPQASFSHQAAAESFAKTPTTLLPHHTFADAFTTLQNQNADYAVIPCENSTNGSVVQTLDLLADRNNNYPDVKVCGEYYLTVHHCLLVHKGSYPGGLPSYDGKINKLYTHPQAWGQCDKFLSRYFKGVERQDVSSTSKAAEIVSKEDPHSGSGSGDGDGDAEQERGGAIASRFAAEFHGVDALAENIEDRADNTTRFLILRNILAERTAVPGGFAAAAAAAAPTNGDVNANGAGAGAGAGAANGHTNGNGNGNGDVQHASTHKTLISFSIDHSSPGALANALLIFKAHGLNLTSINTRPSLKRAWQYIFFVECGWTPSGENDEAVRKVLEDLRGVTESCRDLGTWRDQLGSSTTS